MNRLSQWLVLLLIVTLGACTTRERPRGVAPDAPADAVPDLSGEYAVNGFDPLNTEYGGRLTILPGETADTYTLQWIVTGSIQTGTGRVEGNQLLVDWRTIEGTAPARGTATYTVTVEGQLYGTRSVEGSDATGSETAYPNPD